MFNELVWVRNTFSDLRTYSSLGDLEVFPFLTRLHNSVRIEEEMECGM